MSEKEFDELIEYIDKNLPFKSSYYEKAFLKRRITSRMRRRKLEKYSKYKNLLVDDTEERKELLDTLSVNVSEFFRNNDVWDELDQLIKKLLDNKNGFKAWSAACADGREPYSLAMVIKNNTDKLLGSRGAKILATDIDEDALDFARKGEYLESRTDDIEDQLSYLDNYRDFVEKKTEKKYQIREGVKELVDFEKHDLIKDKPKNNRFDLVLCRNLFIYLDSDFKLPIFKSLIDSLKKGGYLVIGKTESLPREIKKMVETVNRKLRIYRKKNQKN